MLVVFDADAVPALREAVVPALTEAAAAVTVAVATLVDITAAFQGLKIEKVYF